VDGFSVVDERPRVQQRLGYVCEQPKLYPDHRVDTFLHFMASLRGVAAGERGDAVESVIEMFGLDEVRRRRIGVLSKGFRQRVSLAQALVHSPPLLVIDEPTVGLDPRQQLDLRELIQSLGGEHTVILCTHQLPEAEACCDRVALLDRGRLVQICSKEELSAGSLEPLFLESTASSAAEAAAAEAERT